MFYNNSLIFDKQLIKIRVKYHCVVTPTYDIDINLNLGRRRLPQSKCAY